MGYHIRAYATNAAGTAYGSEATFTCVASPVDEHDDPPATAPDLHVAITAPTDQAAIDEEVVFRIDVENVGTAAASSVVLRFPLPPNTEFVSAQLVTDQAGQAAPLNAYVEGDDIVIELGDMAPSAALVIDLVLRAKTAGDIMLTAAAAFNESLTPVTAQASTSVAADDVYWEVVRTVVPVHVCGGLGLSPAFVLLGLIGMKRRGMLRR